MKNLPNNCCRVDVSDAGKIPNCLKGNAVILGIPHPDHLAMLVVCLDDLHVATPQNGLFSRTAVAEALQEPFHLRLVRLEVWREDSGPFVTPNEGLMVDLKGQS